MAEAEKGTVTSGQPHDRFAGLERLWISLIAVLVALIIGAVLITWTGKSPIIGYEALWSASFGSLQNFGELLVSMTPLVFTGLAFAMSYRAGLFNIGGEGQFIVGQIAAAWAGAASVFAGWPAWAHLPAALLAGLVAGGLWGAVPGFLKAKLGVHEVINTIMMNYIALYATHWLVMGPLRGDPYLPVTKEIAPTAMLWRFLPPSRANLGIAVALLAALVVWYIMWRTTVGFEIRAVGFNPRAAEYGGISVAKNTLLAMVFSGGLAGLGGAIQVLGVQYKFYDLFSFTGYGFDGMAVALIGVNHPAGVLAGAALFGVLSRGAQQMQAAADIPKEIIGIVTAVVIILVAADAIIRDFIKKRPSRATEKGAAVDVH